MKFCVLVNDYLKDTPTYETRSYDSKRAFNKVRPIIFGKNFLNSQPFRH